MKKNFYEAWMPRISSMLEVYLFDLSRTEIKMRESGEKTLHQAIAMFVCVLGFICSLIYLSGEPMRIVGIITILLFIWIGTYNPFEQIHKNGAKKQFLNKWECCNKNGKFELLKNVVLCEVDHLMDSYQKRNKNTFYYTAEDSTALIYSVFLLQAHPKLPLENIDIKYFKKDFEVITKVIEDLCESWRYGDANNNFALTFNPYELSKDEQRVILLLAEIFEHYNAQDVMTLPKFIASFVRVSIAHLHVYNKTRKAVGQPPVIAYS